MWLWDALVRSYKWLCYQVLGETISCIAARYGITHEMMLGMSVFMNVVLGIVLILLLARKRHD